MSYILHIESSSTVCSVALSKQNELICLKEVNTGYTHAENLHVFIEAILKEAEITAQQLHAISISTGPGSYTGLRIGYSAAKGMAYALQIPLIEINTLQALTYNVTQEAQHDVLYCPLLDARRLEVYYALYNQALEEIIPASALILDKESIAVFKQDKPMVFFGDGMPKAKALLSELKQVSFIDDITSSSKWMVPLAYQKYLNKNFADVGYAEPLYVKDVYFASKQG